MSVWYQKHVGSFFPACRAVIPCKLNDFFLRVLWPGSTVKCIAISNSHPVNYVNNYRRHLLYDSVTVTVLFSHGFSA